MEVNQILIGSLIKKNEKKKKLYLNAKRINQALIEPKQNNIRSRGIYSTREPQGDFLRRLSISTLKVIWIRLEPCWYYLKEVLQIDFLEKVKSIINMPRNHLN